MPSPVQRVFWIALSVRIAAFLFFNIFLFKSYFFHPDSQIFHYGALYLEGTPTPPEWTEVVVHRVSNEGPLSLFKKKQGYFYFNRALYGIFGPHPFLPALFNVFLGSLMALVGYQLVRRLFGERASLWSGVPLALDPYLIYLSTQFLKDTWVVTLILASVYLYTKAVQERKPALHGLNGLFLVTLASLRPEFAFSLGAVFSLMILRSPFSQAKRRSVSIYLLSFIFLTWVIAIPWTESLVRRVQIHQASLEPAAPEPHPSWFQRASGALDLPREVVNTARRVTLTESHVPFYRDSLPKEPFTSYVDMILKTPRQFLYAFLAPFPWEAHTQYEKLFAVYMLWWYCVMPFFILGTFLSAKHRNSFMLPSLIGLMSFPLAYGLTMTSSMVRYRLAFFVLALVLAGYGLDHFIARYLRPHRLRPAS